MILDASHWLCFFCALSWLLGESRTTRVAAVNLASAFLAAWLLGRAP